MSRTGESKVKAPIPTQELRKYVLLLAVLVATVTYAAAFSPPGGVWQEPDPASDRLAGDPILRVKHYVRYLFFFYCNATAFASSLVVVVILLFLGTRGKSESEWGSSKITNWLVGVMVLDLLSLMGAYAAGACRDRFTTIYSVALLGVVLLYLAAQTVIAFWWKVLDDYQDNPQDKQLRKVMMLLATFALSVTYVAGLTTPGGFWDNADSGHVPGNAILRDRHRAHLTAFFVFSNTAFVGSLLIIMVLLDRKLAAKTSYGFIIIVLMSLFGAYVAGSCRETSTTAVVSLGEVCIVILMAFVPPVRKMTMQFFTINFWWPPQEHTSTASSTGTGEQRHVKEKGFFTCSCWEPPQEPTSPASSTGMGEQRHVKVKEFFTCFCSGPPQEPTLPASSTGTGDQRQVIKEKAMIEKARSLVLLLSTLAATITYQAGLHPPGGVWEDNGDGHKAGDPILLTLHPGRYKVFLYCNSIAFVASLIVTMLAQFKKMHQHHVLEAAMVLDLFGLIGAYAAGSCRDLSTSIYVVALAGAVLVYVVIHVIFFTLDHSVAPDDAWVEKGHKGLLLFATLAATITYQAGLTPPGGFRLKGDESGHRAGEPVLLYNFPRRYKAFFYCNSVSFMLSMALIILLVNPNMYKPAIQSYALWVCMAVGLFSVLGAYAAGGTQHLKSSIYIFIVVGVAFIVVLLIVYFVKRAISKETKPEGESTTTEASPIERTKSEKVKKRDSLRKYVMLLAILVASVTYQAGLDPPGGAWKSTSDGHQAGNPVMQDNRRVRYLAFFYSNSIAFMASIVVIVLLLPDFLRSGKTSKIIRWVRRVTIGFDLFGLLGAYAAGSTTEWKRTAKVCALVIAVLMYVVIHLLISKRCKPKDGEMPPSNGNGGEVGHMNGQTLCSNCSASVHSPAPPV